MRTEYCSGHWCACGSPGSTWCPQTCCCTPREHRGNFPGTCRPAPAAVGLVCAGRSWREPGLFFPPLTSPFTPVPPTGHCLLLLGRDHNQTVGGLSPDRSPQPGFPQMALSSHCSICRKSGREGSRPQAHRDCHLFSKSLCLKNNNEINLKCRGGQEVGEEERLSGKEAGAEKGPVWGGNSCWYRFPRPGPFPPRLGSVVGLGCGPMCLISLFQL